MDFVRSDFLQNPYLSLSLALVHSIPSWLVWAEIECAVHFALPKWPIYQFETVQRSRHEQALIRSLGTIQVLRQHVLTFFRPTHSPYQQTSAFLMPTLNMTSAFSHFPHTYTHSVL
jgi:hypothetical protein